VSDFDEKTRVTAVQPRLPESSGRRNDCLVVIYTKEATLLGKRFVLEHSPVRAGRGADNQIVLDGDSVSRRHCHVESRGDAWFAVDDGSTNGTYVNDLRVRDTVDLREGDEIIVVNYRFNLRRVEDAAADATVQRKRPATVVAPETGWLGRLFGRRRRKKG